MTSDYVYYGFPEGHVANAQIDHVALQVSIMEYNKYLCNDFKMFVPTDRRNATRLLHSATLLLRR